MTCSFVDFLKAGLHLSNLKAGLHESNQEVFIASCCSNGVAILYRTIYTVIKNRSWIVAMNGN